MAGVQDAFCKLVDLPYEAARSKVKQGLRPQSAVYPHRLAEERN